MESENQKIIIFNCIQLKENMNLIKVNCIEPLLKNNELNFDDINKICMSYNNIIEAFNTLDVLQNKFIEIVDKNNK